MHIAYAQGVGIGTSMPAASAELDITSPENNKGLLIPRMTAAQRIAIPTPSEGLIVFQTDAIVDAPAGLYTVVTGLWRTFVIAPNILPGWEMVTATGTVNPAVINTKYRVSVNSPVGKYAIGGGVQVLQVNSSCGFSIMEDSPLVPLNASTTMTGSQSQPPDGLGWTAIVLNRTIANCNYTVTVCAICATATQ